MRNTRKKIIIYLSLLVLIFFFGLFLHVSKVIVIENDEESEQKSFQLKTSSTIAYEWFQTWGGIDFEVGYGIAVDSSGNIYTVGDTMSYGAGEEDIVLVKFDSSGGYQWNRTWGGIDTDEGREVAVDSMDNVYVVGYTNSFGSGSFDIVLVKYDNLGVQQWNRTWGGTGNEGGSSVILDSLDNVYIVGKTSSFGAGDDDLVLIKYDSSGIQQWNRTWGGSDIEEGTGITMDSLANIYVVGSNSSSGELAKDMVLIKFNSFGIEQWNKTRNERVIDGGNRIAVDSLDNVYVAGSMWEGILYLSDYDTFLVKYNSSGIQQWNRTWGGDSTDTVGEVVVDSQNTIYVVGNTESFGAGGIDTVLIKYDISGTQEWYKTWGTDDHGDRGFGLTLDSSDNIYLTGATNSYGAGNYDIFIIKVNKQGETTIPGFELLIVIGFASLITLINIVLLFWRKNRN